MSHDIGFGNPRLVIAPTEGHVKADAPQARGVEVAFPLDKERTTIGGDDKQDIVLEGLADQHAVIDWWQDGDEYVFRPLTSTEDVYVDGQPITTGLHNGDRIDIGPWTLVFQRDEEADHVRGKDRSREGGQPSAGGVQQTSGHETETG